MRTVSGLFVYDYPAEGIDAPDPGDSPLVVLVHGSMDRGTSFSRLRNCLRDLHVVTYDRRGYHRSRGSAAGEPADFDRHAEDLIEVITERRCVAMGHSFGGDIVLAACARRPELIAAAVAFEPPLNWRDWWPGSGTTSWMDTNSPGDAAEAFIRRMIGDARFERLPQRTRAERREEGPALIAELGSLRRLRLEGLPPPFDTASLKVPILVGRGSRTNAHQMRGTTELAAEIPGAELIEIPGAGHGAHLTHPAAMASMIRRTLERIRSLPGPT